MPKTRKNPGRPIFKNLISTKTLWQLVKFGLVGLLNTAITLGTVYLLTNFLKTSDYIANPIGYVLGFINSFVWNKLWTFKSRGNIFIESLSFIIVFAVCYLFQLACFALLKEVLKFPREWSYLIAMALYTLIGFAANKLITFRKGEKA